MRLERATYALAGIAGICAGLVGVIVAGIWIDQVVAQRKGQSDGR